MHTTVDFDSDRPAGRAIAAYLNKLDERGSRFRQIVRQEMLTQFAEVKDALLAFFADEDGFESGREKLDVPDCDQPLRGEQRNSKLPSIIGRYFVRKELGDGPSGQGRVFLALHPTLDRDVAIKICLVDGRNSARNELLLVEGRMLSQLDHPHLAKIYDLDFHEGRPYLVMEFVRGRTLAQAVRHTKLSPTRIAGVLAKVAHGVGAAHARGIVHQDLKPENIVLDEHGEPHVIDFGMARLQSAWETNLNATGGTAEFMAPEQAAEFLSGKTSGDADPRRDVFSLGAVLYFLLTGCPPFQGDDRASRLQAAQECNFDRRRLRSPEIPFHLARICLRAMAKQPEQRLASANELAQQLEQFIRRERFPKRLLMTSAAAVLLFALGAGLAVHYFPQHVFTNAAQTHPNSSTTIANKPVVETSPKVETTPQAPKKSESIPSSLPAVEPIPATQAADKKPKEERGMFSGSRPRERKRESR